MSPAWETCQYRILSYTL